MQLTPDFIADLKYANEITAFISSYIQLKKSGSMSKGLCPFHNEKTPSFTVYNDSQSFFCFGCGAGGDVITFVMKEENLDYIEAIKFLCDRGGIAFPEGEVDDEILKLKAAVYQINKVAAKFYYEKLMSRQGRNGMEYLTKRGFDLPIIKRFGLGFAPDSWNETTDYLKSQGFSQTVILQAWLGGKSKNSTTYDQFRNRVMFPIFDLRGNVIGFSGRTLSSEDPRKYLNSGDTPVFKKSKCLFAMNFAKKTQKHNIIVCEGNLDVMAIHRAGFENCVATLGTALTNDHARLLSAYTNEIILAYDSDAPGQKATKRAIGILSGQGFKIKILKIDGAKDPDEYIKKFGAIKFAQLVNGSDDSIEYQLKEQMEKYDLSQPAQKAEYIKKAVGIIAYLSFIERDIYASKIADEMEVDKQAILYEIKAYLTKAKKWEEQKDNKNFRIEDIEVRDTINPQRNSHYKAAKAEENLIASMLKFNDAYKIVKNKITPDEFVTEFNRKVFEKIIHSIEETQFADIAIFYGEYSQEEISKISGMIAKYSQDRGNNVSFNSKEIFEFINNIKLEKSKPTQEDIKNLHNEDLKNFIDSLRENKK